MTLPLQGVGVLDLSRLLPGGFCSLLLADFGADVLKVEDTGMGDYVRWSPPYQRPGPALGEHTAEVLGAAGYSAAEIVALEESGAVAGPAGAGARGSFLV
jgi:crotonobetainyl-CoA:carnitine CoA-transferase CaiB-like acyl-CoA transferase